MKVGLLFVVCTSYFIVDSEGDASDGSDSSESDEDDKIPFACLICHEKWTSNSNPVITQ